MKDNKLNAHRLNVIQAVANKPELKLKKTFRQPTDKELTELVVAIVEYEFKNQADEATRAASFKLQACYDEAYPHHERYVRHIKTVEIDEQRFKNGVHFWGQLSEKNRRKALAMANEFRRATLRTLAKTGEFLEHQQDLMKDWDDSQLETIAKIQKQMGLSLPEAA